MNCLTTTVINLGHSSISAANCLDRCSAADCFWTSDSRKWLHGEKEKEDSGGLVNTVQKASAFGFRHSCMKLWGEYDLALVKLVKMCAQILAFTFLAHAVVRLLLFIQFRSCLNLTWSHINVSVMLTILLWDYSSKFFSQNCSSVSYFVAADWYFHNQWIWKKRYIFIYVANYVIDKMSKIWQYQKLSKSKKITYLVWHQINPRMKQTITSKCLLWLECLTGYQNYLNAVFTRL